MEPSASPELLISVPLLTGVRFTVNGGATVNVTGSSPLIINCSGAATVTGTITLKGNNGSGGSCGNQSAIAGAAGGNGGGGGGAAGGNGGQTSYSTSGPAAGSP